MTNKPESPAAPAKRAESLSRDVLVKTALEIVDRDGLAALSMRKLGAELGVDPMAAYRHLPNKESLLDAVIDAVVAETVIEIDEALSWQDQMRQLLASYYTAVMAHPNALPLLPVRQLRTPASLRVVERALQILVDAGTSLREAVLVVNVAGLLTVGVAMAAASPPVEGDGSHNPPSQLSADDFPMLTEAYRTAGGTDFSGVLRFAVDALLARIEATEAPPNQKGR